MSTITSQMKTSKKIILGVTGGIAAYKSCELVRLLKKNNYDVWVILTEEANKFVTAQTFQALSGNPVLVSSQDYNLKGGMGHIDLTRQADLLLIAPITANSIAKIANGIADNLLLEMISARNIPLLVAPAMNIQMWLNPANQRNIEQLKQDGISILGPDVGSLACGEEGAGRMLEPEIIIDLVQGYFASKVLKDKQVLITTGGTKEMIDPVRCLTNLSTGRMGIELAKACRNAGAEVVLIHSDITVPLPYGMKKTIFVETAEEMYQQVHNEILNQDIFISVAAVSDYKVDNYSEQKIKKQDSTEDKLTLELTANPDILASVAALDDEPFCVGFAAESEHLLEYANVKRLKKNIPLIIANKISDSLGLETNAVYLLGKKGTIKIKEQPKNLVAQEIVRVIAEYLS